MFAASGDQKTTFGQVQEVKDLMSKEGTHMMLTEQGLANKLTASE